MDLENWVAGQWDGYTPDQLLDVLLAQPVWAEGEGLFQLMGELQEQVASVWDRLQSLVEGTPRERAVGALVLTQHVIAPAQRYRTEECRDRLLPLLPIERDPAPLAAIIHGIGVLMRDLDDDRVSGLLAPFADHSTGDIRFSVACALGWLNDDVAIRTLIALSADTDSDVRDWATFGLGTLGDNDTPEVRDALVANLNDDDSSAANEALLGLVKRADHRVLDQVFDYVTNDDVQQIREWNSFWMTLEELLERWDTTPADPAWLPVFEQVLARELWEPERVRRFLARCRSAAP